MSSLKTVLLLSKENAVSDAVCEILSPYFKIIKIDGITPPKQIMQHNYVDAIVVNACENPDAPKLLLSGLNRYKSNFRIPVIIVSSPESAALQSVTNDRLTCRVEFPIDSAMLLYKLRNAIFNSQIDNFNRLKYNNKYDSLTGLYNRNTFYTETKTMLANRRDSRFLLVRFDINRFSLFNSFYGSSEGDRLLKYLAGRLKKFACTYIASTFGRIEADVFALCVPFSSHEKVRQTIYSILPLFKSYNRNFDISPCFGLYIITDITVPVSIMLDRAALAAKKCKGNYLCNYYFFDENMENAIKNEQEIINEMNTALNQGQFKVYLQPKYSLMRRGITGAEALVRWQHPEKGLISPADFIPVFEKNGFISKLDNYMLEQVCGIIRGWIDGGRHVFPISVNVSRVDLYNPCFTENLCRTVDKYSLPHSLIHLELTESAYTDNPEIITEIISKLQKLDFQIYMDDFGSGYSSLNILKDLSVDVLKLDLKFLTDTSIPGRGENILASVVRMAKWLSIPTVIEGVEKKEQVNFLYEIGCEYAQGYYFARPLTVSEYERLIDKNDYIMSRCRPDFNFNEVWQNDAHMREIFSDADDAIAICEYSDSCVTLCRVNSNFSRLFGYYSEIFAADSILGFVAKSSKERFLKAFKSAADGKTEAETDYEHIKGDAVNLVHLRLEYKSTVGKNDILIAYFYDVTAKMHIEKDIEMHKFSLQHRKSGINHLLIIDSIDENRQALLNIFDNRYTVSFADDEKSALAALYDCKDPVNIIILDSMIPDMDSAGFMMLKNSDKRISEIPVVLILSDDSLTSQYELLALGANDYITKPFVGEVALRRVNNVLFSHRHIKNKYLSEKERE